MGIGRSVFLAFALFGSFLSFEWLKAPPGPGQVLDEARRGGVDASRIQTARPETAAVDYFRDMDGAKDLSPDERAGRITWIVWSAGNDRLWDIMSRTTFGSLDFLKTLSSYPGLKASRDNRWEHLGLVNEPCFEKATGPDPNRFGLWLDKRKSNCPADPFEDESKYPGIRIGNRGRKDLPGAYKELPTGSLYGYATGVVGLRLFPNPDFDDAAARNWDPARYYTDKSYYESKELVKPYRVGMSCGFCHVGPSPVRPPQDPNAPEWSNLASNVGAQYFWTDRIFSWPEDRSSFVFQFFKSYRPGALDTSLISTDNINNPRTMNAIYHVKPRLLHAKRWGKETLHGGSADNRQFNDYPLPDSLKGDLSSLFQSPATAWSPRVLKDGSDSVGALGALNRVFLNIGLFSEEWLLHFNAVIGGKPTTPIEIKVARRNSTYWQATEAQTPALALFFLKTTEPHYLKDAPGGSEIVKADDKLLHDGKVAFANYCARCHSSKLPEQVRGLDPNGCSGPDYLNCWNRYWRWTKTEDFKRQMRDIVLSDNFLKDNFFSTELRVPVTLLQTNACSPLATNAIRGNIWDNFSSETYKDLPPVGSIQVFHPMTGKPVEYVMPGGGRGYTRPPSLVSVWSTAPLLLNNSLGRFNSSPSVAARLESFQDSIEKLLLLRDREPDDVFGQAVDGRIDRTTEESYLRIPVGYLPNAIQPLSSLGSRVAPWLFGDGGVEIGPIPKGTPVNLLANLDLLVETDDVRKRIQHDEEILKLLFEVKSKLKSLPRHATQEQAVKILAPLADKLLPYNKCPDFVVNRGHYFGTSKFKEEAPLSEPDKRALIAFLKTL